MQLLHLNTRKLCVAAQRQKVQLFGQYIPKQMTEEELAVQAVSYSSQGAR